MNEEERKIISLIQSMPVNYQSISGFPEKQGI